MDDWLVGREGRYRLQRQRWVCPLRFGGAGWRESHRGWLVVPFSLQRIGLGLSNDLYVVCTVCDV